jgi:hypothetical protein
LMLWTVLDNAVRVSVNWSVGIPTAQKLLGQASLIQVQGRE